MIWILNLLPEPANPGDAPEDLSFGHNRQTFIQNWPYVLVPGTFSTKIQEKKRQTYKTHLVLPISNFLVLPDPVNASFHFPGEALILIFMATHSELVVKGHGLWYQKVGSEHSSYTLPALFSTGE